MNDTDGSAIPIHTIGAHSEGKNPINTDSTNTHSMSTGHDTAVPEKIGRMMPKSFKKGPFVYSAMAKKITEDINFLTDRIERVKKLQTPNPSVLKTYQSMLESRQTLLQWLQENDEEALNSLLSPAVIPS